MSDIKSKVKFCIACLMAAPALAAAQGQFIPNGNMEVWDSVSGPLKPAGWLINDNFPSLPCAPPPNTADRSADRYDGDWAAQLQNAGCIDDLGNEKIYIGLLACGEPGAFPHLPHGISYRHRPPYLRFFYKFQRIGSDTGYAQIALLALDSAGFPGQTVGKGSIILTENVQEYTQIDLSIEYYTLDTPDVVQIVFSTNKTLTESNRTFTTPGTEATPGTTLWVDGIGAPDTSVWTSDLKLSVPWALWPNPMDAFSILRFEYENNGNCILYLSDMGGRRVREYPLGSARTACIERGSLPDGIYFLEAYCGRQRILTARVLMRH